MENLVESQPADADQGFGASRGWWVVLGILAVWHALLTLGLFGPETQAYSGLTDERPIISGRHALHLYHGYLGAKAFAANRGLSTYDPYFYAGYPKTPWFDAGSKPAELMLWLGGAQYKPAAWKLGVAATWALLPLIVSLAAWSAGLNRAASAVSAFVVMLGCWNDCGRELLWSGDIDTILASAFGLLALCLALLYHRSPNILALAGVALALWATCFTQAFMFLTLLPLVTIFYFATGWQHRTWWHLGLLAAFGTALAGNWFWLNDALRFWWIRAEPAGANAPTGVLALFEFFKRHQVLEQPMLLGLVLVIAPAAALGIIAWHLRGKTVEGRLFALACSAYGLLALSGGFWAPHLGVELNRLLFTALVFSALPTGQFFVSGFDWMGKLTGTSLRGAAVTCAILATIVIGCHVPLGRFAKHLLRQDPLPLGFPDKVQLTVEMLQKATTNKARLLYEETKGTDAWTPLFPVVLQRQSVGGLGADARIEHGVARMREGKLAGRSIEEWSDTELADYCRRYNIAWVVCQTKAAQSRFGKWSVTADSKALPDGSTLFTLRRPQNYVLQGKGSLEKIEPDAITLTDLAPAEGTIVLSFHFHPGIRPSADRVRIEKEPQMHDGIPYIRLRLTEPLARLTLRWDP